MSDNEQNNTDNVEAIGDYEPPVITDLPNFNKQNDKLAKLVAMRNERLEKIEAENQSRNIAKESEINDDLDDEAFIDDELEDEEEFYRLQREKKESKKRHKKIVQHDDADPDQKTEIDKLFDEALQNSKSGNRRKRNQLDVDVAMEQAHQIIHAMRMAADDDRVAVEERKPAFSKLELLPRVKIILMKAPLWDVLLDEGVLNAVADWLRPFDDGTLPALEIRRAMLEILEQLPIDTDALRESDVGRVLYFYCRCKIELPSVQRKFQALMNRLVARVLNKSSRQQYNYKTASATTLSEPKPKPARESVSKPTDDASGGDQEEEVSRFVRVTQEIPTAFEYIPQSTAFVDREEKRKVDSRHKRLKQIIQNSSAKSRK